MKNKYLKNKTLLSQILAVSSGLALIALMANIAQVPSTHMAAPVDTQLAKEEKAAGVLKNLGSAFLENIGQLDNQVKYYSQFRDGTFFVDNAGGLTYNFAKTLPSQTDTADEKTAMPKPLDIQTYAIKENFTTDKKIRMSADGKFGTEFNHIVGNDKQKWKSGIPGYSTVKMEINNNISVELKSDKGNIEKIFTVNPGSNPADIKINVEGSKGMSINNSGELEISTPLGKLNFSKPVAFQMEGANKKPVEVQYSICGNNKYGFSVGNYDTSLPLIIDPYIAGSYLGASDTDSGQRVASDSSGNIFVLGYVYSTNFPANVYDTTLNGTKDMFLAKFDSGLNNLLAATYFGGSVSPLYSGGTSDFSDSGTDMAIDPDGNVFITGYTSTSDFPMTAGTFQTTIANDGNSSYQELDMFVSKFNNNLNTLLASTYLGGTSPSNPFGGDASYALAIDNTAQHNIYIAGYSYSQGYNAGAGGIDIPITSVDCTSAASCNPAGAHQSTIAKDFAEPQYWVDIYVAKLSNDLTTLKASTFVGGSKRDIALDLALDSNNNVFILGESASGYAFSSNVDCSTYGQCAYYIGIPNALAIAKLNSGLTASPAAVLFDRASPATLTVDSSNNVYFVGTTTQASYPTYHANSEPNASPGDTPRGTQDMVITKMNNSLSTSLLGSVFFGGSTYIPFNSQDTETPGEIRVDANGYVYLAGATDTTDFPTTSSAFNTTFNGNYTDAFISKFNFNTNPISLVASTYFGTTSSDYATGINFDSSGNVIVTGSVCGSGFPTREGNYDRTISTCYDAYVSKLSNDLSAGPPDRPTSPFASSADSSVNLFWNAPQFNGGRAVTSYTIYYGVTGTCTPASPGAGCSSTTSNTTSKTVTGLTNGTNYSFAIYAVNSFGTSSASDVVTSTPAGTPPNAPTGLAATPGNNQVGLTWNAASGATSYKVYRANSSNGYTTPLITGLTSTNYTDTSVTNGNTYYYVVTAVNVSGESGYSNEVSATPNSPPPAGLGPSPIEIHLSAANAGTVTTGISDGTATPRAAGHYINSFGSPLSDNYASLSPPLPRATHYAFDNAGLVSESSISYGPDTLTGSATVLSTSSGSPQYSDDYVGPTITLPFYIHVFGQTTNQIAVSSNGYIYIESNTSGGFTTNSGCCAGQNMSSQTISGSDIMVAGTWSDLYPPGQGTIKTEVFGSAPSRRFVIEFNGISPCCNTNGGNTFQIKLFEASVPAPDAPANLAATPGDSQVGLTWNASSGATSYSVYRADTSNGYSTPLTTGLTSTNYTDTSVTNGNTYYYVVTASNTSGESVYSNEVSASPASNTPSNIEVHLSSVNAYTTATGISDGSTPPRSSGHYINSFGSPVNDNYASLLPALPRATRYGFNGSGLVSETGITYAPDTFTGAATLLSTSAGSPVYNDDYVGPTITLPFNINIFGQSTNKIAISSNGYVFVESNAAAGFSTQSGCCSGEDMSTQAVSGSDFLIAGTWSDLYPPGLGTIKTEVFGSAPSRRFVVEFNNISPCCDATGGNTFQIKFFEPVAATDTDSDSIPDNTDNCPAVPNTDQANTDAAPVEKIFYTDYTNDGIYVMDSDGSNKTRLTNGPNDFHPSVSGDGSTVVFVSGRDGNNEIYKMNSDGTGQTRLTNNGANDYNPAISQDGTKIVFTSHRDGNDEIYIMNSDGTGQTNITNNAADDNSADFNPAGTKIAFSTLRDHINGEIYTMNPDGTGLTRLTNNVLVDITPSYSPDGNTIVFSQAYQIKTMTTSGTGITTLATIPTSYSPHYNADGTKITYVAVPSSYVVYVMNANGTSNTPLTFSGVNGDPDFGTITVNDGLGDACDCQNDTLCTAATYCISQNTPDPQCPGDTDNDGVLDNTDNCVNVPNTDQADIDGDNIGNVCDCGSDTFCTAEAYCTTNNTLDADCPNDPDGDGVSSITDNCPTVANPDQADTDPRPTTQIAFEKLLPDGPSEVYRMNVDGSTHTRLTFNETGYDGNPSYGPDLPLPLFQQKIAFSSYRVVGVDLEYGIYTINPDGTGETFLTAGPCGSFDPEISPDGTKIVFVSNMCLGNFEIFIMDIDGSNITQITNDPANDNEPTFTPDGNGILFSTDRDGNTEIYYTDLTGSFTSNVTNSSASNETTPHSNAAGTEILLVSDKDDVNGGEIYTFNGATYTRLTNDPAFDSAAVFSTEGDKIAFTSDRDNANGEIYTMNLDGTNVQRLTTSPGDTGSRNPSYGPAVPSEYIITSQNESDNVSMFRIPPTGGTVDTLTPSDINVYISQVVTPDASKILYPNYNIYSMDLDGNNVQMIHDTGTDGGEPTSAPGLTVSPDGTKLAYSCYDGAGDVNICIMNIDGSGFNYVTTETSVIIINPAFSADSTKIAYELIPDGQPSDIYSVNLDGTNNTNLTDDTNEDSEPVYSTDGSKIFFFSATGGASPQEDVYSMDPDGTNKVRLTTDGNPKSNLRYSPVGNHVSFYDETQKEIYVMTSTGTNITNVSNTAGANKFLGPFSPDGTKLTYYHTGDRVHVVNIDGTNNQELTNFTYNMSFNGLEMSWVSLPTAGDGIGDACDCQTDGSCTAANYCADNSTPDTDCGAGVINVTSPIDQEWNIGTNQTIAWTSSAAGSNVNIDLYRNGISNPVERLFTNIANDGLEDWTVTGSIAFNAVIRISSVSQPAVYGDSANFMITTTTPPSVRMRWTPYTGTIVANQGTDVGYPKVIRTSDGQFITFWQDNRNSATTGLDLYTEKFNANGAPQWNGLNPGTGIPAVTAMGDQISTFGTSGYGIVAVPDNSGGAIFAWEDGRDTLNSTTKIYVQKVNSDGTMAWTSDGINVSGALPYDINPKLLADGNGGAYLIFETADLSTLVDIQMTHIAADGTVAADWNTSGSGAYRVVNVTATPNAENQLDVALSNDGDILIAYIIDNGGQDILANKMNPDGTFDAAFPNPADVSVNSFLDENNPKVISDGAGGMIVVYNYHDPLTGTDIHAQKLDATGTAQWGPNGNTVVNTLGGEENPQIVSDNDSPENGVIVVWEHNGDIYAQKIRHDGVNAWGNSAVEVSNTGDGRNQYALWPIVSDGANGIIVHYLSDGPEGTFDLMAQNLNGSGVALWDQGGDYVETLTSYAEWASSAEDGRGGAVLMWPAARRTTNMYIQNMRDLCPPAASNQTGPGGVSSGSCAQVGITGGDLTFTDIPDNTVFSNAQNNTALPSYNNAAGTTPEDILSVSDLRDDPGAGFEVQLSASPFATSDNQNFIPLEYLYVGTSLPRTAGATDDETEGIEYSLGCSGPTNDITGSVNLSEPATPGILGSLASYTVSGSNLGSNNTTVPVVLMSAPAAARRCIVSQNVNYAVDLPSFITALGTNIPNGIYTVTFTYTLIGT